MEDAAQAAWLNDLRRRLTESVNRLWDAERHAYPDSVHADGAISCSISQHTSLLAVLYDVIEKQNLEAAMGNMLHPPADMVRVGSLFAMLYFYEALEKIGRPDAILASLYESYLPMLAAGATTVWEVFPSSAAHPGDFPTRSHCHAWSAAPLYFLNRLVLGIKAVKPGGAEFEISPRLSGLTWAKGAVTSARGPVSVDWRVEGGTLQVKARAPQGVTLRFVPNETHAGLQVNYSFAQSGSVSAQPEIPVTRISR